MKFIIPEKRHWSTQIFVYTIVLALLYSSCKSNKGLFSSDKTLHEKYGESIRKAGLGNTNLGNAWFKAANQGLLQPTSITLPYRETGFFADNLPRSAGLKLNVRQGEKINVSIITVPDSVVLFTELWSAAAGKPLQMVSAADSSGKTLQYEADSDESLVLRIQSELLAAVEYTVSITTAPSLAFPVPLKEQPRVSSFWGADRDGGIRKHEGVDIFAKKRTPLVAAANGRVMRVNEKNLGGKVVFIRPHDKTYTLYYAHLDSQLVVPGQEVKTGDVIGLMGNTGNARTTPPHLHFGIYARGGAVDPFPFINHERPAIAEVKAGKDLLNQFARIEENTAIYSTASAKSSVIRKSTATELVKVNAATADWYRVQWSDSSFGFVPEKKLSISPLKKQLTNIPSKLLAHPDSDAPSQTGIDKGRQISLIGKKDDFFLVRYGELQGWIHREELE
jgi:murein DD-endopeptidase MepM/ murein hydrolase activator NlpD